MTKKKHPTTSIVNRRARFDYELIDELVAGIALTGPEVRAVRSGRAHLKGAFATVKSDELWLNNASLSVRLNNKGQNEVAVDTRARKLLVHKKQLQQLAVAKQSGLTIVPLKLLTQGKFIKVVLSTAKGKKQYDKRQVLKKRDEARDINRALKSR